MTPPERPSLTGRQDHTPRGGWLQAFADVSQRGEMGELRNLHGLGTTLVALRIALGLTQRELAERLGVHESQVSRDERNEYHAVTVDRASRILDALGVDLRSAFEEPLVARASGQAPSSRTAAAS